MLKYSVISPVHNEAGNIEELTNRVHKSMLDFCGNDSWEFILVDDCSSDNSRDVIRKQSLVYPQIRYILHKVKSGQTGCFKSGFMEAKGEAVITIDADLQVFPEDIPYLLTFMEQGYDLVNGKRIRRQDSVLINLASRIFNILMHILFKLPTFDATSNFAAIRSRFIRNLTLIDNDHRYLIPILKKRGLNNIKEVFVRHQKRKMGSSKYSIKKLMTGIPELVRVYLRIKKSDIYCLTGQNSHE
jgi:glycosyltransferase involved in cell wall biosynthesis